MPTWRKRVPRTRSEHRTGHVMVPAKDGLLVIGGLAYNGEFQNDVQHIRVF